MFVDDGEMQRECLRQGDILGKIPYPLIDLAKLQILGQIQEDTSDLPYPSITTARVTHRNDTNYFTGMLTMRLAFYAVMSHCCELEPRNGQLICSSFSLARLIPIKESIAQNAEKLDSLRANKDPRTSSPGFIDYFHIASHERLSDQEWMVDFSQIISLPKSEFPGILSRKLLQMDNRTRVKFKIKLATYLGRITKEEAEEGIREPWS